MLGLAHFDKMVKMAREEHIILILTGDFNYETKQLYQMPPIKDVSFLDYKFDNNVYFIKLTKNYRQQNDIEFGNFLFHQIKIVECSDISNNYFEHEVCV